MSIPKERTTTKPIAIRMVILGAIMMSPVLLMIASAAVGYSMRRLGLGDARVDAVRNPDGWTFGGLTFEQSFAIAQLTMLNAGLGAGFIAFFGSALLFFRSRLEASKVAAE